jgi:hypothetical protein
MQTDLYTKAVLTVIALALSAIALQHAIPSAFAQSATIQRVMICGYAQGCANISKDGALWVDNR